MDNSSYIDVYNLHDAFGHNHDMNGTLVHQRSDLGTYLLYQRCVS